MKTLLLILVLLISTTKCNNKNGTHPLKGKWIDYESEESTLLFTDSLYYFLINTDTVGWGNYKRHSLSCNTSYADRTTKSDFIVLFSDSAEYCYEIMSLSDSVLSFRNTINGRISKYYKNGHSRPSLGPD
jgi:mRNA-degrading endonuclease YafQ of YafQ-DinJ toxin-antitoxin module